MKLSKKVLFFILFLVLIFIFLFNFVLKSNAVELSLQDGTLVVLHEDDFKNKKTKDVYLLQQGSNLKPIDQKSELSKIKPGSQIRVKSDSSVELLNEPIVSLNEVVGPKKWQLYL